jgi:hypothetical protein
MLILLIINVDLLYVPVASTDIGVKNAVAVLASCAAQLKCEVPVDNVFVANASGRRGRI